MPKGALLHAHLDATVNVEVLWQLALKQSALHVRASGPINASTIKNTVPEFIPLPRSQLYEGSSLTDEEYVPDRLISLRRARETFDKALGGPEGFDKWVFGALTINPNEAYKTHNTVPKVCSHKTAFVAISFCAC